MKVSWTSAVSVSLGPAAPGKQRVPHDSLLPKAQMTRGSHVTYKIPYVYHFIIKLCRQQAEFIWIYGNEEVRKNGGGEVQPQIIKGLKHGAGQLFK
jgi:hypothetical protein